MRIYFFCFILQSMISCLAAAFDVPLIDDVR